MQSYSMGLRTMIRKIKKERNEMKMLILGLDNSGKTTILHKAFNINLGDISPTFGYQIHNVPYASKNLIFLDIGGQSIFRNYWSNYYEKLDGLVYVFDLTDSRPIDGYIADIINDNFLCDVPILILGNKSDLCGDTKLVEKSFEKITDKNQNVRFAICSAITGEHLDQAFQWLVVRAQSNLEIFR